MTFDDIPKIAGEAGRWIAAHEAALTIGVGGLLVLLVLVAIWRARHTPGRLDRLFSLAIIGIIMAFSAEGMWEVVTGPLDLPGKLAAVLFVAGEGAMVLQARRAEATRATELREAAAAAGGADYAAAAANA